MDKATVDSVIKKMLSVGDTVSDLLFIAGKPPLAEVHGILKPTPIDENAQLSPVFIDELADYIIGGDEALMADYANTGSCDCSYAIENVGRFRVNVYKENRCRAIVMRKLQSTVPTLSELSLPPVFGQVIKEKNGIVLVTGAAGSGKTTSLAAMINELNQTQPIHIITLEDPIEFLHPHARAAISHRELGRDFTSFADGLRSALRQAPKAILVGEIRDRETMEIALTAAETGHLVFSTLHTINAGQTINRILGFFTNDEQAQVRYRLCDTVRYIVSQRLIPKQDGGRLLITEVLGSNLRSRESIRYGESEGRTFHEIIDASTIYGWHTFDSCLLEAFRNGSVTEETTLLYCNDKGRMRRALDLLKKTQSATEPEGPSSLQLEMIAPAIPPTALSAETVVDSNNDQGTSPANLGNGKPTNRRVFQPRPRAEVAGAGDKA
jgi:twitching motility protein PilT